MSNIMDTTRHQGILQLAHDPAAIREQGVYRWLRHPCLHAPVWRARRTPGEGAGACTPGSSTSGGGCEVVKDEYIGVLDEMRLPFEGICVARAESEKKKMESC